MKQIKILLLFSIALIFVACQSEHTKKSLQKVDQLISKTEELTEKISTQQIRDYDILYDTIKHYNNFFIYLPEDFEESEENLDIVYRYGTVEKTFKWLHINFINVYLQDLDYSRNQLTNLREDISNKLLTEEEIDNFIHSEDSVINVLEDNINATLDYAQEHYEIYRKYQPKVLALIEEYGVNL